MLAVVADASGYVSSEHRLLERQADAVVDGGAALGGLGHAYPPVPTFLAGVLPGGELALSVVAALFAGVVVQVLAERLVLRRVPAVVAVPLLLTLVAAPAAAFVASEALPAIAVTALFALAIDGFTRFVIDKDTEGGFVAGLSVAAAAGFDDIALVFALALAVAVPSIAGARYRAEPGSAAATLAVVLFPVAFVTAAWAFLEWRFTGELDTAPFTFRGGVLESFDTAARTVLTGLGHVPLYVLAAVLHAWRRPTSLVGYLAPVLALVLGAWLGLGYSPALAYVLLAYTAVVTLRRPDNRLVAGLLIAVAILQIALSWWWVPTIPSAWLSSF
ncbi:hypothetical protein SAMN05443668_11577 [Cryptosporangium aurantiacum]|uniref:Dolichyl-phosphate-mannose-protein mannosyltransferase n=1 Tax=Cryptosporangium aurantiacum TaxID=134849 RepID=A0A1M7RJS1_9ACTN|nr:hypothetical protein SAMN05443668_11577 [Cryptosporangium aurantiacum]